MLDCVLDHVILKPDDDIETTESGILLLGDGKERTFRGKVVAIGPGKYNKKGKLIPMEVSVGDYVIFGTSADTWIEHKDEKYLVMHQTGILAKIKKDNCEIGK
jgi:chaperonin GroES